MTDKPSGEPSGSPPSMNLRDHRQKTERNLVLAGFAALLVVGGGVIWYFYGFGAAMTAWVCMAGGMALFGALYLILKLIEMWVARRG